MTVIVSPSSRVEAIGAFREIVPGQASGHPARTGVVIAQPHEQFLNVKPASCAGLRTDLLDEPNALVLEAAVFVEADAIDGTRPQRASSVFDLDSPDSGWIVRVPVKPRRIRRQGGLAAADEERQAEHDGREGLPMFLPLAPLRPPNAARDPQAGRARRVRKHAA